MLNRAGDAKVPSNTMFRAVIRYKDQDIIRCWQVIRITGIKQYNCHSTLVPDLAPSDYILFSNKNI